MHTRVRALTGANTLVLPRPPPQLNMAAVEVTRLHGLPPIDVGSWVFGLPPQTYLDDQHHPSKASGLGGPWSVAGCLRRGLLRACC
jgi:hypothetical protein